MKTFVLISLCFLLAISAQAQIFRGQEENASSDSAKGILDLVPKTMTLKQDTSKFLIGTAKALNRGSAPIRIKNVEGSCYCSRGLIQNSVIYPLQVGTIVFQINLDGLKNGENSVLFSIYSDAANNPYNYRVFVQRKKDGEVKKDKTDEKRKKSGRP